MSLTGENQQRQRVDVRMSAFVRQCRVDLVAFQADQPDNDAHHFPHCPHKQNDYDIAREKIKRRRRDQTSNYRDKRVLPGFAHKPFAPDNKKASRPKSGGLSRSGSQRWNGRDVASNVSTAVSVPAVPVPLFPGIRCNGESTALLRGVWH